MEQGDNMTKYRLVKVRKTTEFTVLVQVDCYGESSEEAEDIQDAERRLEEDMQGCNTTLKFEDLGYGAEDSEYDYIED